MLPKSYVIKILCVISVSFVEVDSARILGVFQFPSYSHQIAFQPIWKELSLRGHQVVVVTPNPLKNSSLTNLTEIDMSYLYNSLPPQEGIQNILHKDVSTTVVMRRIYSLYLTMQEAIFKNKEFANIYTNPEEQFDLILMEAIHPVMYSLSYRFNAPVIGINSLGTFNSGYDAVGNPTHPVLYPDLIFHLKANPNIFDKIGSFYFSVWFRWFHHFVGLPEGDALVRKYLGDDMPYLGELEKNVSLLFLNVNPAVYKTRANVPSVIELCQMHIQPLKPLPTDLKKILDDAKEGVIYFSLGSNVKSANLPNELKKIIVEAMAELPYTFLWKWESDNLIDIPKNVFTRKWLPQQDILAHPNIKAFLSQGGLQSSEEAIARGVPIVGMPFLADQPMNVQNMVQKGIAIGVDPDTVTKEELKKAIVEVAENERYRNKIREMRDLINDQPMTGLEKAVWWSEYVIRHKGAKHLRSSTADASWHDYLLLDVLCVVLTAVMFCLFIILKLVTIILKVFASNKKLKVN